MSLITDTGKFSAQVDFAMGASIASGATTSIGAATGNTLTVTGTTTITSLGDASQIGVTRKVIFSGALTLTHSETLKLFGLANIVTVSGDVAEFVAISTTAWVMISFHRSTAYTNGQFDGDAILNGSVTAAKIGDAAVDATKQKTKGVVDLADTAVTLTAAQLFNSGIFTAAPTAARTQTTDTAANIISALVGYQIGTSFEFTIVNTAAFNETLAAGVGVSIIGSAVVNNASATFRAVVMTSTTVNIYRK